MSRRTILIGTLTLGLAAGACGGGTPDAQPTTPSPSATPTATGSAAPSPSPTKKPTPAPLVLYTEGARTSGGGFGDEFDVFLLDAKANRRRQLTSDGDDTFEADPRFRTRNEITWVENETEGGKASLWSYRLKGGQQRRLFRISGSISAYDWDRKGERVAYLDDNEGRPNLYVWKGGSREKIRSLPRFDGREGLEQDEIAVTWSPNGSMIMVVDTRSESNSRTTLFVVEPDGSDVVQPKFGTFGRWSPDGARVYYRNWESPGTWYRLDVASESRKRLDVTDDVFRPAVSPDGHTLAYDDGRRRPNVYLFDLRTGEERRLQGARGVGPIWLSRREIAITDTEPCNEHFDDPDACQLSPPWFALRTTTRLRISDGRATELSAHTTLGVDVLLS